MSSFNKKMSDKIVAGGAPAIIGFIVAALLILFFYPWIAFWLCYFEGWIAKLLIGNYLVEGFAILGITVPIAKIPLIAGLFGWVGGFFKGIHTVRTNN